MGLRRGRGGRTRTDRGSLGQALVEFALVAPILILIFAGLVQLALIYERQIGIENAVRDGARRAATYPTDSTNASANGGHIWTLVFDTGGLLQASVEGYDGNQLSNPQVCYRDLTDASGHNSVLVKVSMTYKHPLFMPIIGSLLDPGESPPVLRVSTSSEFTVANASAASVGGTVCSP